MRYDPSCHVHIDWKVGGLEWLALLRDEFPAVDALQGKAFEALLDELAHEEVESCLQTLANRLHAHNYEVWNLDVGADDFRVALVPASKRAAFERYWKKHKPVDFDDDEEVDIELKRIAPEEVNESEQASHDRARKSRKKKPDWLAETKGFKSFSVNRLDVHHGRVLASRGGEMDEDRRVRDWWFWQLDLREWPPTFELLHKQERDDPDRGFPHLLAADAEATFWQWDAIGEGNRLQPLWMRCERKWTALGPPDTRYAEPSGSLNSEDSHLWQDGWLWCVRNVDIGEERRWQVSRTSATATEILYEAPTFPGHLHALGSDSVLLVVENRYRIWNGQEFDEVRPLPAATRAPHAVAWLGGDEILFFDHFQRDIVPPWWRDDVLRMWRFDVVTGTCRCVEMEGFGIQYNAMPLEIDGAVKKRKSMSASPHGLHLARGHGDWWVINYNANVLGVRTIAWFWNAVSNEVIKITSKDIPRWTPTIVYIAAMDRYLGLDEVGMIRLPEFETIRAANGGEFLEWQDPPAQPVEDSDPHDD
ncbi:hypothetical protein [Burkholderia sp. Ax-1719]|uniref:hypothetical protein n=1 Tax=Burkholderia sp. Ax-1719 TaxID=2608334 RepID=UPI001421E849|nr:hypothetical protein [Burkholderia sp. Ax-1719]NIE64237.1 hypothetical protein [Burkholderia sp. Ax-1719]